MRLRVCLLTSFLLISGCIAGCSDGDQPREFSRSNRAIMNGTVDSKVSHNGVVALIDSEGLSFCTGTLIDPEWVLTAGHCVVNDEDELDKTFAKNNKVGIGADENSVKTYSISNVILHAKYGERTFNLDGSKYTLDGDIALLKLKTAVPSSVAAPIPAHPDWLALSPSDLPMDMEFVGYGYNEEGNIGTKLGVTGPIAALCAVDSSCVIGEDYCDKGKVTYTGCHPADYEYGECTNPYYHQVDYIYMPCGSFYYLMEEAGPCNGDSGGPMFDTVGGKEYVNGITSYGDPICASYGVSTSVQDYFSWIRTQTNDEIMDQYVEICGNGVDDDGDGLADCEDSDCANDASCQTPVVTPENCSNGVDDDGDGLVDCADSDCENDATCQTPDVTPENCSNGVDDDSNGLADCEDPACLSATICAETPSSKKQKSDSCRALPQSSSTQAPFLVFMLGGLMTVALRRRKNDL